WNGIGSEPGGGTGNIGFWSTGFSRVRQDASDVRLPIDGAGPNPLVVVSGTVDAATAITLTAAGAFAGRDLAPPPVNARYDDPDLLAGGYVVTITPGAGGRAARRIASDDPARRAVAAAFGALPQPGDGFEVRELVIMPEAVNP